MINKDNFSLAATEVQTLLAVELSAGGMWHNLVEHQRFYPQEWPSLHRPAIKQRRKAPFSEYGVDPIAGAVTLNHNLYFGLHNRTSKPCALGEVFWREN